MKPIDKPLVVVPVSHFTVSRQLHKFQHICEKNSCHTSSRAVRHVREQPLSSSDFGQQRTRTLRSTGALGETAQRASTAGTPPSWANRVSNPRRALLPSRRERLKPPNGCLRQWAGMCSPQPLV